MFVSTSSDSCEVAPILSTSLRISFVVFMCSGRVDKKCCNVGENVCSLHSSSKNTGQEKDLALPECFLTVISVGVVENQESNLYAETKTTHGESESSSQHPHCE